MEIKKLGLSSIVLLLVGCSINVSTSPVNTTITPNVSLGTTAPYQWPTERENPFFDMDCPDPCIYREDDGYFYIFTTQSKHDWEGYGVPEMSYIPIIKSKDMVSYEYLGSVFTNENRPRWSRVDYEKYPETSDPGLWAPDVIKYNGTYYCYYSLGTFTGDIQAGGIGVATAPYIDGPYTDHGMIMDGYSHDYGGGRASLIDQCVMEYEGKLYMFYGSYAGLFYVPLSDDGLSLKEGAEHTLIAGVPGYRSSDYEGGYIRKMNDKYYLFASYGSFATYTTTCFKSDNLFGPYTYYKSVVEPEVPAIGTIKKGCTVIAGSVNGVDGPVKGPGHNALFQDDAGEWYILYHGYDRKNENKGRILFYDKLLWDENDFPYVEGLVSSLGKVTKAPYFVDR